VSVVLSPAEVETFTGGSPPEATCSSPPRRLVVAPIGAPHTFANADADAPALLLCTTTPADFVDQRRYATRPAPAGQPTRIDNGSPISTR
jgi:hypothetical protein